MKAILSMLLLFPILSWAETFTPTISVSELDGAVFASSQQHQEMPIANTLARGPQDVLWTADARPEWRGVSFGKSTEPTKSHLRLGFKNSVTVGSVLVRGGGLLSVLKPTASYPGDLEKDSDWMPAERTPSGEVDREDYGLWLLPPGTSTRALRFSHVPELTDKDYTGWLGGCSILPQRLENVASQAVISASKNASSSGKMTNGTSDRTWDTWESVTREQVEDTMQEPIISPNHSVWIQLSWPQNTSLSGLCGLFTGFGEAEVFGTTKADASEWKSITKATGLDPLYPLPLGPNWIPFPEPVTVRAIRLVITKVSNNTHNHMKDKPLGGHRVFLAELLALHDLQKEPLKAIPQAVSKDTSHPPIPISLKLEKACHVTLVIENAKHQRVRNLLADTPLPAGNQTVWWDGLDDLGRDPEAARHGVYHVPGSLVTPGTYTVRGLCHQGFDALYEFPIYTAGTPAWNTEDHTGAWLSNHTPPQAALFVPADRSPAGCDAVYLGSYVSEGTHGLAWVDLDGKKLGGMNWVGGNWTGAPFLACDRGEKFIKDKVVFSASVWPVDRDAKPVVLELRLNAITKDGAKQVAKISWPTEKSGEKGEDLTQGELMGLAAHNGTLAVSLGKRQLVMQIDVNTGKVLSETTIPDPRGLAFDAMGRLLALSGKELLAVNGKVVVSGLEDPQHVCMDSDGNIYISDHGNSHQVKAYSAEGKLLRSYGLPGGPKAGPYDENHLQHPAGISVDSKNRLWVAEQDEQPKRVSVWSPEGKLQQAFYGPSEYGGGGKLDPQDKNKFYYRGMEFHLDWEKGTSVLARVFHRPATGAFDRPDGPHGISGYPESPVTIGNQRYFSNSHNSNPTGGPSVAMLWWDGNANKSVVPVAAMGRANDWPLLATAPFHAAWPAGIKPPGDRGKDQTFFIWSDSNQNAQPDPEEFKMQKGSTGGILVEADGTFVVARLDGSTRCFPPQMQEGNPAPNYSLEKHTTLASNVAGPASSGGDQAMESTTGWTFLTLGVAPYHQHSLSGTYAGEPRWSYPNPWPGLHASHEAAMPEHTGEIIGITRLLGDWVETPDSAVGPVCFLNSNMGPICVFTADGLFVTQLFQDSRVGTPWAMPKAIRGMKLNNVTPHDENFWPSVTRTADGQVYVVDGGRSSLIHITGWENLHALPPQTISLTSADIAKAATWQMEKESVRQKHQGQPTLAVTACDHSPTPDDWKHSAWAVIDQRGVRANFNSNSKPYDVQAALILTNDRLYAHFKTGDAKLLVNSGEMPTAPFKTGGSLDLMLLTDLGEIRVLVTKIKNQPQALLYRSKAPGTKTESRIPFSSPHRTLFFDQLLNLTPELELTDDGAGNYVISLPRKALGLTNFPTTGDLGILRGDGQTTTARVYWSNKATVITADVPSEAELQPKLWGKFTHE